MSNPTDYPRMIAVYIASQYTMGNPLHNVRRQIVVGDRLMNLGYCVVQPLMSHFHHELFPHSWEEWMAQCLEKVRRCDAVLRIEGESKGADMEVEEARRCGIPVVSNVEDLLAVMPPTTDPRRKEERALDTSTRYEYLMAFVVRQGVRQSFGNCSVISQKTQISRELARGTMTLIAEEYKVKMEDVFLFNIIPLGPFLPDEADTPNSRGGGGAEEDSEQ